MAALLLALVPCDARADQTNVMEQLRKTLMPKPSAWGEIRVGTATRADPDPRSGAVLQAFQQLLALDPSGPPTAPIQTGATVAVPTNAIQRLKAEGRSPQLFVRPGNGTVMQIRGGVLEPAGPTSPGKLRAADARANERTARNFLRSNRELLRLDDPDVELNLESEQRDEDGAHHLRFSQRYKEITLWPSGLSVHLDPDGNVGSMDGAYAPTPTGVPTVPILTAEDAAAHAKSPNAPNGTASDFVLVIYSPLNLPTRLAWKFKYSTDLLHSWLMVIDAEDGRILNRVSLVLDASVPGSANDLEGLNQNFNVWSDAGKFYMIDTTKQSFNPAFDPVKDPHGAISIFDAREVASQDLKTIFLVDSISATTWLPDAVSALFNFSKTYDYYLQRHARNSLDGNGGNIQAVVRISQLDNA
ncbi:MAG TPA: hypothetical protein VGR78_07215, partial [Verrucomicrobiae bacterium]|nr:hypothetical protein [Verrucomicrobiae bacterium]